MQRGQRIATARREQTARALALHGFTLLVLAGWWAYSQLVPAYLLPGPVPVRVLEIVVIAAAAMVALYYLFEWAGDLLDSGGVVG